MSKIKLTREQLLVHLTEQVQFLKSSSDSFDSGSKAEYRRMAVNARVLLHNKKQSRSLMHLLGMEGQLFVDSARPYDDGGLVCHCGLVRINMTDRGAFPQALLDDAVDVRKIPFEDWWNGVVIVDAGKIEFSRRDIVLTLADQDGGAHVDPEIGKDFHDLRNSNSLGWNNLINGERNLVIEDQVPATMRQISHEIIKTFDPGYGKNNVIETESGIVIHGMSLIQGDEAFHEDGLNLRKDRAMVDGKKIGRNDSCLCGSGIKYKKCCLR